MKPIYLICGVPGSGKTWVSLQLEDDYTYVPHDDFPMSGYPVEIFNRSRTSLLPIVAEAPFAERVLKQELEDRGLKVIPVFIVERPEICKARYEEREKRSYPVNHFTRASSIGARASEWKAFRGTSQQVLEHLKEIAHG